MSNKRLSWIAPFLMIGCTLGSVLMALFVDGNGGLWGLEQPASRLLWATNALVGIAAAFYLLFRHRHWRIVAALAILVQLVLFVPLLVS